MSTGIKFKYYQRYYFSKVAYKQLVLWKNFQQGKIVLKALHWAFFCFTCFQTEAAKTLRRKGKQRIKSESDVTLY